MKKLFCVLLSLVLLCLPAGLASAADAQPDFVPVLRFVAASDTHILGGNDAEEQRIRAMIGLAYDVAESDPAYDALDAVLIAGDLTNDGTKDEFDRFWDAVEGSLKDGTRFLGVVAKNHDGYEMKRAELRGYYTALTGNEPDSHVVIGGYHFIGVSASPKDGIHYTTAQLKWLQEQLEEATSEDPDKPVFVYHHEPPRGTVYGSSLYDGWGVGYFTPILSHYPQVVDFAGHSHYPLNDPRSIWQGSYTAVNTGAVYYSEFTVEGLRVYHPADSHDTSTCWIVEVNASGDMRLRGYDILAGEMLVEETLANPAKRENRDFTPARRKAAAKPPVWEDGSELAVAPAYGTIDVTAPTAVSADGTPVTLYRAEARNRFGLTVAKEWIMPSYYRVTDEESVTFTLAPLAAGEYTVRVTAENAYGMAGAPLTAIVTVDGDGAFRNLFARVAKWFADLKAFFVQLFW